MQPLTHGEAVYLNKKLCKIVNGEFVNVYRVPKRMPRDRAIDYYNAKLFNYWLKIYNQDGDLVRKLLKRKKRSGKKHKISSKKFIAA